VAHITFLVAEEGEEEEPWEWVRKEKRSKLIGGLENIRWVLAPLVTYS
jgi:hypothetical protein